MPSDKTSVNSASAVVTSSAGGSLRMAASEIYFVNLITLARLLVSADDQKRSVRMGAVR